MQQIINNLKCLNRKERFHLIGTALGNKDFKLAEEFRNSLNQEFAINIPPNAFVAMDYHIDWIWASLYLYQEAKDGNSNIFPNNERINSNQEDVDFIIAYVQDNICHIVMLEAKAETGWTYKQMRSKAERLIGIFKNDTVTWRDVIPHFAIVSPREPQGLRKYKWPEFMCHNGHLKWIELKLPNYLRVIKRCDANGKIAEIGDCWKIK